MFANKAVDINIVKILLACCNNNFVGLHAPIAKA